MKKIICVLVAMMLVFSSSITAFAGTGSVLNISKNNISHRVSENLYGVSLEDSSFGGDGGLAANMVNNNSFEYAENQEYGWTFGGVSPVISSQHPIDKNNPTYETITADGLGIVTNNGYTRLFDDKGEYDKKLANTPNMIFEKGRAYYFSCYLMDIDFDGAISVFLDSKSNKSNKIQLSTNNVGKNGWTKISLKLTSDGDETGGLGIQFKGKGSICLDYVSLVPDNSYGLGEPSWKNVQLNNKIVGVIKDLKPSFIKFPGNCVAESYGEYSWKNTIGDPVKRKQTTSIFNNSARGYFSNNSNQLGYHEYFQLSRDLNTTPVPVVDAGISCQTKGDYEAYVQAMNRTYMNDEQWEAYLTLECGYKKSEVKARTEYIDSLGVKSSEDFDKYINSISLAPDSDEFTNHIQDILDLIEYANGDANSSYWASVRRDNGSEEPFNLKYIQVGGDNYGDVYWRNFEAIRGAIAEKYPDVIVVASTGYSGEGEDFDTAWNTINSRYSDCYAGEKYIDSKDYPMSQFVTRYDSYSDAGAGVLLGEYRSNALLGDSFFKNNNMLCAVEEGAFITGLERNSHIVRMASYGPAISMAGASVNEQSLAWLDGENIVLTPSYYTQLICANNLGKDYVDANLITDNQELFQSVTVDENTETLYVKLVNTGSKTESVSINLEDFGDIGLASVQSVSSNYKTAFNGHKQAIAPIANNLSFEKSSLDVKLEPYSVNVVRIAYGDNSGKGFYIIPDTINLEVKSYIPMSVKVFIILLVVLFIAGSFGGYFAYSKLVLKGKKFKFQKKNNNKKENDDK